jgi:AAA-like domain
MNLQSTLAWEQAKETADTAIFNQYGGHLKDVEIQVLQGSWEGMTYEKMAEQYYLSVNYLRGDIGNKLWQKLSSALGEEVTKHNFKGALERASRTVPLHPTLDTAPDAYNPDASRPDISRSVGSLFFPEGPVPLDSPFYIESEGVESLCYAEIDRPAALIRIKAPRLMGKTSLIARILAQAQGYRTVYLDFNSVERGIIANLDKFLRWLCLMVGQQLQLDNQLKRHWDTEILGSNDNCTAYFEEHLLSKIASPLVLALDNVDRIFPHAEVVEDFLGMLRSWHEKGKIAPVWKQLRLVLAHSTECYIPLDLNQSPFNAGVPVELLEFDSSQVRELSCLYGLVWDSHKIKTLMDMIGGHPYLAGLAFYEIGSGKMKLEQLLHEASTEQSIYSNHLRRHLETLQRGTSLADAFSTVVMALEPVELDATQIYKLHSMGLVRQQNNQVMPRCSLYRDYFRRVLSS